MALYLDTMATNVGTLRSVARTRLATSSYLPRWSAAGWGAIAVCGLFLAITLWWLLQNGAIPIYDAGFHLLYAFDVHEALAAGHLGEAFKVTLPYPPLAYLVGAVGMFIGGVGVMGPIMTENIVFVPLLALGCYQLGKRAFGPTAGLLAVVFALGSPLIIPQFHVFMTDAPETALVAAAVWLIIASERFSRIWISAAAGVAVGLGMLTKEPFVFFVIGPLAVTFVRAALGVRQQGWGAWRGMAAFAAGALVVALPWYASEFSRVNSLGSSAVVSAGLSKESPSIQQYFGDVAPPRFSLDNYAWYFWNMINFQLFLPLFVFAAAGWLWMVARVARRKPVSPYAPELLIGSFVSWLAITETFIHDTRYSMPLLVYLAVIGSGWIVRMRRPVRIAAAAALVLVALANTLATSFGVGETIVASHAENDAQGHATTMQHVGEVVLYSNGGFQVAGPKRDGDLLGVLRGLEGQGVQSVIWNPEQSYGPDFSQAGVSVLSRIAGLQVLAGAKPEDLTRQVAVLRHEVIVPGEPPPCAALDNGTGVWVYLGNPEAHGARYFCPLPKPHFYGPPRA